MNFQKITAVIFWKFMVILRIRSNFADNFWEVYHEFSKLRHKNAVIHQNSTANIL